MTIDPANAGSSGLVDRIKSILLKPQAEWDRIAGEPAEVNKLYIGYVLPLAALAAVAGFIGTSLIGTTVFGVSYRMPLATGVVMAVLQVIAAMVGIFIMALVTNALAPTFGSQQDQGQAHKLAVYGATAALLGGLFAIFPPIAILGLLAAIYSLVLIWIGLPRLMKTPEDKRVGYFATIIVVCIVVGFVINMVLGSMALMISGGMGAASPFGQAAVQQQQAGGEITLPGGGTLDVGELQRQATALEQGETLSAAVDPARLQQMLPQSLPGGFALASTSSGAVMGSSQATAEYRNGDAMIELSVMHMGAMGALAGMAGAMNVQESSQNENGYSRTQTVDGRVITENVDTSVGSASYGVVGRGVAVTADGSGGVSIEQVRAAVQTVGVERLEREIGS